MTLNQDILKISKLFNADRVRFPTNNELMILGFVSRMEGEASTGNLIHAMVLAHGKGFTFNQVTIPLKQLGKMGLVTTEKAKSESSGRTVDIFRATDAGIQVLTCAVQYADTLQSAKTGRKALATTPQDEQEFIAPKAAVAAPPARVAASAKKRASKVAKSAPKRVTKKAGEPTWPDEDEPSNGNSQKSLLLDLDDESGIPKFLRRT